MDKEVECLCGYAGVAQWQSSGIVNRRLSVQIRSLAPERLLFFGRGLFIFGQGRQRNNGCIKHIKKYGKVALKQKNAFILSMFFMEKHKFRQYVESMHKIVKFV